MARWTWSQAVTVPELEMQLAWYRAYYRFCQAHQSLRTEYTVVNEDGELVKRYRQRTPAMAAGWTKHRWRV